VVLPSILLEGDLPPTRGPGGPGEKFALGPTPPAPHGEAAGAELPEAYGTQRLHLTVRDPHWLYANWDLTREQQMRYNRQSADGHLILRLHAGGPAGPPVQEIHVHPESRHWFANVAETGAHYAAELGFYRKSRKWTSLAVSNTVLAPAETASPDTTPEFATIPPEVPLARLAALAAQSGLPSPSLARAVEVLRQTGHPDLPRPAATPEATAPWTTQQERALANLVRADATRPGGNSSLEVGERGGPQPEHEFPFVGLAPPPPAGVELGAPPAPAVPGVTSPGEATPGRGKGFWLNVNTELIVYGATEPDASLSVGGRKIPLRPDGTFSCRFALPDGKYDLAVVAVAADQTDGRAAELKFVRATEFFGAVGAQPPDPALKPPTPDEAA
jgi:hypothetical protein